MGFLYEVLVDLKLPVELLAFDYYEVAKKSGLSWRAMGRVLEEFRNMIRDDSHKVSKTAILGKVHVFLFYRESVTWS